MKKQIKWIVALVILVILLIVTFNYVGQPAVPSVGADGKISGNYALGGIMRLGKPYICKFQKTDGTSQIAGVIHTDGKNIYGEFRLKTDLVKNEFNSYLMVINSEAYTWTSLGALGYKLPVAKSATSGSASPAEQAQIVGTNDVLSYDCNPWQNPDLTIFQIPTFIKFSEPKA
jgi:hypothetical protein